MTKSFTKWFGGMRKPILRCCISNYRFKDMRLQRLTTAIGAYELSIAPKET